MDLHGIASESLLLIDFGYGTQTVYLESIVDIYNYYVNMYNMNKQVATPSPEKPDQHSVINPYSNLPGWNGSILAFLDQHAPPDFKEIDPGPDPLSVHFPNADTLLKQSPGLESGIVLTAFEAMKAFGTTNVDIIAIMAGARAAIEQLQIEGVVALPKDTTPATT